jgi:hypothetical protein
VAELMVGALARHGRPNASWRTRRPQTLIDERMAPKRSAATVLKNLCAPPPPSSIGARLSRDAAFLCARAVQSARGDAEGTGQTVEAGRAGHHLRRLRWVRGHPPARQPGLPRHGRTRSLIARPAQATGLRGPGGRTRSLPQDCALGRGASSGGWPARARPRGTVRLTPARAQWQYGLFTFCFTLGISLGMVAYRFFRRDEYTARRAAVAACPRARAWKKERASERATPRADSQGVQPP